MQQSVTPTMVSIIVRTQHSFRYVIFAACVFLVVRQLCNSLQNAGEAQQYNTEWNIARPATTSCRALFTVTDVTGRHATNASLFIQDLQGYSHKKFNGDWRERAPPTGGSVGFAAAAEAVKHLLRKRVSPSGATTADYLKLAALLPSVLVRQTKTGDSAQTATATTTNTTRIGSTDGLLPFVPCRIATYTDTASVTACFKERIRTDSSFWIYFMGDSKIRFLFYEFLAASDGELKYSINLQVGLLLIA